MLGSVSEPANRPPKSGRSEAVVLVGTSFRRVGFERLGRYVLPLDGAADLAALRDALGASELCTVATCNRVEAYAVVPLDTPREGPAHDAAVAALRAALPSRAAAFFAGRPGRGAKDAPAPSASDLFALVGEEAIAHLFAVVASLDSLVLGECEIAGQVRRAADAARAAGIAGRTLARLFERAAKVAKRVRSETAIGRTPVSVASLVLRRVREHFRERAPRRAALVGVGDVTKKVAAMLEGGPTRLLFVNRTLERAEELARRHGGVAVSLESFRAAPPADLDLVVTATRAPAPVVDARLLAPSLEARAAAGHKERLLVCDLGVPHDVAADVDPLAGALVLRLADLEATARENRERLEGEVGRVRAIVALEARRAAHESRAKAIAAESAEALLAERLAHLAPADRDAVRRFASGLAERLLRQPA
jgi:glutamyl-tRNA reductase